MHKHIILIVESEVGSFVGTLQAAIDQTGAETLVVRDPYCAAGEQRLKQFDFSAAVINTQHRNLANQLDIPCVIYDHETPTQIVSRLLSALT